MENFRKNILFYMTSILAVLVLISLFLLSGIYAKYVVTSTSDDTARVAKFDVGNSGVLFTTSYAVEIDPVTDDTVSDALILTNSSEVAVGCSLKVRSVAELPLRFTWTDGENEYSANVDANAEIIFPPLASEKTFDLVVSWDTSAEENKSFIYRRQVDKLVLDIECEQLD